MHTPSPSMQEVAQRLLVLEAKRSFAGTALLSDPSRPPSPHETVRVCDAMRLSLSRFAGPDGFTARLRRSLWLARAHLPAGALGGVTVGADGTLEGWDETAEQTPGAGEAILTQLLELLEALTGRSLALRLVHQAWPAMPVED